MIDRIEVAETAGHGCDRKSMMRGMTVPKSDETPASDGCDAPAVGSNGGRPLPCVGGGSLSDAQATAHRFTITTTRKAPSGSIHG